MDNYRTGVFDFFLDKLMGKELFAKTFIDKGLNELFNENEDATNIEIDEKICECDNSEFFFLEIIPECKKQIINLIERSDSKEIYVNLKKLIREYKDRINSGWEKNYPEIEIKKDEYGNTAITNYINRNLLKSHQKVLFEFNKMVQEFVHDYFFGLISNEERTDILKRIFYDADTFFTISHDLNWDIIRNKDDQKLSVSDWSIGFLFHYLRENNLILKYKNLPLSKIVSPLAGISQHKLRRNYLPENLLFERPPKGDLIRKNHLLELKQVLEDILSQIDSDLDTRHEL